MTAKRRAAERGQRFRTAKLFWWFNQGADVEISVTPKPYYGADGNKVFGITGEPQRALRAAGARPRPLPFSHVLGSKRRASLHAMDRRDAPPRFSRTISPS